MVGFDYRAAVFMDVFRPMVNVERVGISELCVAPNLRPARGHDPRHLRGFSFVPVRSGQHDFPELVYPEQARADVNSDTRFIAK